MLPQAVVSVASTKSMSCMAVKENSQGVIGLFLGQDHSSGFIPRFNTI